MSECHHWLPLQYNLIKECLLSTSEIADSEKGTFLNCSENSRIGLFQKSPVIVKDSMTFFLTYTKVSTFP